MLPFAAMRSNFDCVEGVFTADRGKTHKSEPVSTRNCIFETRSVTKRRPVEGGQSLAAISDRPERFPSGMCKVAYTYLPLIRMCSGNNNVGGPAVAVVVSSGCVSGNACYNGA